VSPHSRAPCPCSNRCSDHTVRRSSTCLIEHQTHLRSEGEREGRGEGEVQYALFSFDIWYQHEGEEVSQVEKEREIESVCVYKHLSDTGSHKCLHGKQYHCPHPPPYQEQLFVCMRACVFVCVCVYMCVYV
jgi:hypothetical protein